MADLRLAFRALGDFLWPPVPIGGLDPTPTPGAVEVFFFQPDGAKKSEAIMRWTRADRPKRGEKLDDSFINKPVPLQNPGEIARLHGFTKDELSEFVGAHAPGFALRLGKSKTSSENKLNGQTLNFHGASLIDQFFEKPGALTDFIFDENGKTRTLYPTPKLRIPVLPTYRRPDGEDEPSGLVFAQSSEKKVDFKVNDNFRVDAVIPDPIEPEGSGKQALRSIRIDAVIGSKPDADKEGRVDILVTNEDEVEPYPGLPEYQRAYGGFNLTRKITGESADLLVKESDDPWWPLWKGSEFAPLLRALGVQTGDYDAAVDKLVGHSKDTGRLILRTSDQFEDITQGLKEGTGHLRIQRQMWVKAKSTDTPGGGDASITNQRLTLNLHKEGVGRFYFPKGVDITLETDVRTVVTDEDVFEAFRENGTLFASGRTQFEVRLFWDEELDREYLDDVVGLSTNTIRKLEPLGPESGHPGWFSQAIANALVTMHRARVDLKHLEPGRSVSFLPELGLATNKQNVRLMLRRTCAARRMEDGTLQWGDWAVRDGNGADGTLTLTMREEEGKESPEFRMFLPGFSQTLYTADHSHNHAHIRFARYPATLDNDLFVALLLLEQGMHSAEDLKGRVGSLLLVRADGNRLFASFDDAKADNSFQLHPRSPLGDTRLSKQGTGLVAENWNDEGLVSVTLNLALQFDRVSAVSTGTPQADGLPNALLIPLDPRTETTTNDKGFALKISEKLGGVRPQPRSLTVSLFDRSQRDGFDPLLRLQRHPWSIIALNPRALSGLGTDGTTEVAFFDVAEGVWKIRSDEQVYRYILPPMVTGESADKPGRLEIHDRKDDNENRAPYPKEHANGLRRYSVESRLSPAVELWIDPADRDQSLVTAPWDTNELFMGVQEGGSGVRFLGLRGEFLYAMPVAVDGTRRSSPARVAELTALLGQPPRSTVEGVALDPSMNERWKALSAVHASRPERLEVWQPMPGDFTTFAPARFDENVVYALRKSAVLRHPNDDAPEVADALKGKNLTFHPQGLAGGALWPIEQRNLVAVLAERPESSSGRIEKIALSPHGGDAEQEARFNGNQVRIISSTRSGFIQSMKVEVIGRIGVFWHRAKHVVVYARTVNPTAQFAPKKGSETRSRRAILRKVSEYVELLEPERSYPDFDNGEERTSGPVRAVRFQSRNINVDSFWGEDIDTWGWRVPLWNRGAAVERPQVYEKPQISFVTSSEGGEENATSAQDCTNPQNLYFVADFVAGHDRTDEWQSRPGVDFSTLPPAGTLEYKKEDVQATATGRRPGVSRVPLGQSRFTWLLSRSGRKTDMMAGRAPRPVYVDLESVTFSRSSPTEGGLTSVGKDLADAAIELVFDETYDDGEPLWFYGETGKVPQALTPIGDVDDKVRAALAASTGGDLKPIRDELEALKAQLKKFETGHADYSAYWARVFEVGGKDFSKKAKGLADKAKDILGSGQSVCEKLKTDLLQSLRRKQMLVVAAIESGREDVSTALGDLPAPRIKEKVKTALNKKLKELASPVFEEASEDIAGVGNSIASARGELAGFQADLRTAVERARARLDAVNAAYERDKPWSANRFAQFTTQLDDAVNGIKLDADAALDDLQRRLRAGASGQGEKLSAALTRAMGTVLKQEQILNRNARGLIEQIESTVKQGNSLFEVGGAAGKLQAILEDKRTNGNLTQPQKDAVGRLIDAINAGQTAVGNAATGIREVTKESEALLQEWQTKRAKLNSEADAISKSVNELIDKTIEELNGDLAGLAADILPFTQAVDKAWNELRARIVVLVQIVADLGEGADAVVQEAHTRLNAILDFIEQIDAKGLAVLDFYAAQMQASAKALSDAIAPQSLLKNIVVPKVFNPAIDDILAAFPDDIDLTNQINQIVDGLDVVTTRLNELVAPGGKLDATALDELGDLTDLCSQVEGGVGKIVEHFGDLAKHAEESAEALLKDISEAINLDDLDKLKEKYEAISAGLHGLHNDVETAGDVAQAYAQKVLDQLGDVTEGGLAATPNNLLRLYSTVTSAPEIAALKANIDRIRSRYDALKDIVDTTEAKALFDVLGDRLKALGLDIPFNQIGRSIVPANFQNLKFGNLFPNVGSLKLDDLFPNVFAPGALKDYVTITHDFDKKAGRAWLHVDVKVPLPQRSTLFTLGPFNLDFVNSTFTGKVHVEASEDTEQVSQSGSALIRTNIEAIVAGQKMVGLERVGISYTDEGGLDLDFDPSQIKLHPTMKIIQETVGNLFPEEVGGLELIKQNGVPIGMEHVYRMPTVDANAVTSGVMNLFIANRFSILAYPDFVIANRFNVSTKELPFIFSIFILGGTGYLQIDSEYRPFDKRLAVTVTAAAGGSAALAFAVPGVSGSVFVALTINLSYQRVIGATRAEDRGTGLTVALSLVIAGNVNVLGIVSVYIGVLLDMLYRENGAIDATGVLTVRIRISRFFKISVRREVKYKLRNGRSTKQVTTTKKFETDANLQKKLDKLNAARRGPGV